MFSDKMMVHLIMLCPCMESWILCHLQGTLVVVEEWSGLCLFKTKLNKNPFELDIFSSCIDNNFILCFRGWKGNIWLLLATPWNNCWTHIKTVAWGWSSAILASNPICICETCKKRIVHLVVVNAKLQRTVEVS